MNAQTDTALLEDDQESAATEPEQKSTTIKDDADEQNATKTALDVSFLALDGSPIPKMGVAVCWEG